MDDLERDVLEELARARVTRSSVTLAEELFARKTLPASGDPFGLVWWTLERLNKDGLITYRQGHGSVPVDIRVTDRGYRTCGYETYQREVGIKPHHKGSKDDASRHPGDATDFRNFDDRTTGGAIERMAIEHHILVYRDHAAIHYAQLREINMGKSRSPVGITADQKLEMRSLKLQGLTLEQIGARFGVVGQTVDYHLKQLAKAETVDRMNGSPKPLAEIEADSLRTAILRLLDRDGTFSSARELARSLAATDRWRAQGLHSIQHVLHAMTKQGLVESRTAKEGNQQQIVSIKITSKGLEKIGAAPVKTLRPVEKAYGKLPDPEVGDHGMDVEATNHDPHATQVQSPTITYPILEGLRSRGERAAKLRQAAVILKGVDDETAKGLEMDADLVDGALMDVENEYLKYAEEHPDAK